jgi:glycosyltransferase involved in cell wall biosynthesis
MTEPIISIIVPVYNGEKFIETCLESLKNQTFPTECYEVIIVDNGSSDKTIEIAKQYDVIIIKEWQKGSYAARNAGIKIARGKINGFIDVDCIASDNWLEQAVRYFSSNPNAEILSGKVEFFPAINLTVWGYFDKNTFLDQGHSLKTGTAKTANLFVKKTLFEKIGLFSDEFSSGGDVYWTAIAVQKGFIIHYEAAVIVFHPIRNNFSEITKKCYRVGLGKGQILKKDRLKRRISTLGYVHYRHPFKLLSDAVFRKDKGRSVFFTINLIFAVFILSIVSLFGVLIGLLRPRKFFIIKHL